MRIAVASPHMPSSINQALTQLNELAKEAAQQGAKIICLPESYMPGYPANEFEIEKSTPENLRQALDSACTIAKENAIAIILPMDWFEQESFLNVAFVIDRNGNVLGYQTKNQLDPSEDNQWQPGTTRDIFEIEGLKFGISICHEGFRYPETVRWAARHGAALVFHPHFGGSNIDGKKLTEWGHKDNPYYEKAMMMRALENTIYFASSNYATSFPESASSIIAPDGTCIAYQPYEQKGVAVVDIDLKAATGLLANRLRVETYSQ